MSKSMRRPDRRFMLSDGIVLVAASSAALMIWRYYGEPIWHAGLARAVSRSGHWQDNIALAYCVVAALCPFAAVAAPTLLALRLRAPRPRRPILWSQPGASACLAVIVVMLFQAIWNLMYSVRFRSVAFPFPLIEYSPRFLGWMVVIPTEEGLAVAATWMVLAVGGRLRPEPSWIDRAGRIVGVYFVACLPLVWLALW